MGEETPGCAIAVIEGGEVVYRRGFGMADLSHGAPITPETRFHVASVSKQFTAAAVLLLAEAGKLSLDDDICLYLPELRVERRTVTVRHLLTNTSGLRDQWDLLAIAGYRYGQDLITDRDVIEAVAPQSELNFPPGTQYRYSNTGFTLAARIVERVSGESFRQFTTRTIFNPLGMHDSHFRDDHTEINTGEAWGYLPQEDGTFRLAVTNFDTVGATSLYTTVDDLARWDANFYDPKIGGADFCRNMTTCPKLMSGATSFYAMGLMMLSYRGLPIVEHGGADAGYRANILRFPEQRFSVISLFNTSIFAAAVNRRVADIYLANVFVDRKKRALRLPREGTGPAMSADGRAGFYRSRITGSGLLLGSSGGNLTLIARGKHIVLESAEEDEWYLPESVDPARFEPPVGEALRLVVLGEGKPAEIWDRFPPFRGQGGDVHIIGRYYSEELDAHVSILRANEQLVLRRKRFPDASLIPVAVDLFASDVGVVEIVRDADREMSAILLTTSRVRNLRLSREMKK